MVWEVSCRYRFSVYANCGVATEHKWFLVITMMIFSIVLSQHPSVREKPYKSILIKNCTIYTGAGDSIENGILICVDSTIVYVGRAGDTTINESQFEKVIDARGGKLYPGIIAMNTRLGLIEIDALRPTRDVGETHKMTPEVVAYTAYNVDSRIVPTALTNGILIIESAPYGGTISGFSSIMRAVGMTKQDALIKERSGLHVRWPYMPPDYADIPPEKKQQLLEEYKKTIEEIRELFLMGRALATGDTTPQSAGIRVYEISRIYKENLPVFIHADREQDIKNAVLFFTELGVKNIVITGGRQIYKCLDFIKKYNVKVVFGKVHSLPLMDEEPIDIVFRTPYLMYKEGIEFCLGGGEGWGDAWDIRNLPFYVGSAIAYGLPYGAGVSAVTSSCAKILGIDKKYGKILPGYSATFIISRGDIFNPPTSVVEHAFIDGREIHLDDYHKYMFRRYMEYYKGGK